MNHQNWKSLERVLDRLERQSRRSGRRITPAALVVVAGLFLGYLLLAALVPQVWPALLATEPGEALRGWPLLVWQTSEFCLAHRSGILAVLVAVSLVVVVLTYRVGFLRPLVWLSALGVVVVDAGILATTLLACLQGAGVGF
jgi:hypothetical protein